MVSSSEDMPCDRWAGPGCLGVNACKGEDTGTLEHWGSRVQSKAYPRSGPSGSDSPSLHLQWLLKQLLPVSLSSPVLGLQIPQSCPPLQTGHSGTSSNFSGWDVPSVFCWECDSQGGGGTQSLSTPPEAEDKLTTPWESSGEGS